MNKFSKFFGSAAIVSTLSANAMGQINMAPKINRVADPMEEVCNDVQDKCQAFTHCGTGTHVELTENSYTYLKANGMLEVCMSVLDDYNHLLKNKARIPTHNNLLLGNKFPEDKSKANPVNNAWTGFTESTLEEERIMYERMLEEQKKSTGANTPNDAVTGGCGEGANNYNRNGVQIAGNNGGYEVRPDGTIIMNGC